MLATTAALLASTLGVGAASATATSVPAQPAVATTSTPANSADSDINGYRNVGYFTQWGVYGRDFKLKKVKDSGAAADLTHINYSFGNIHHETLRCFIANKAQGQGPNGSDGAGDAWADFGMGYTAANSVSGVADSWDQPLAGSFNQLKQLKAEYPHIRPMISLGGWTWSKNFSRAAATDASRKAFVSSCIDIYIKGNLPVIDGRGGPGAAAGVFDGIDIDWEWPGSLNGEVGNHVDVENDARNFKLLLAEFRAQLDAYGAQTGRDYLLSAFLPANPDDIEVGGWNDPEIFEYLDFGNVQGYDLHGAWDGALAGHQGNLYDDPADPRAPHRQFSVDKAVKEYVDAGIDPAQLGLGLAAYGRGWKGVTSSDPWSAANGAAPGTWEAGNEDYDKLRNLGTGYFDADTVSSWRYDGNQWWSFDDPQSVAAKADYIVAEGLGGGMWWDLSGNHDGTLLDALMTPLRAAGSGPVDGGDPTGTDPTGTDPTGTDPTGTDPTGGSGDGCLPAWSSATAYSAGATVSYDGQNYRAKWWTQNNVPGTEQHGPWESLGACGDTDPTGTDPTGTDPTGTDPTGTDPTGTGGDCLAAWSASTAYSGGATVSYDGQNYRAKWWTQNNVPGAEQWGPWEALGSC
ncbi:glycosyl hydrolase family 18 protein [Oerskovia flava]|uniref:glycosyl hydrolase family 18 protein n=1 Tax=Oerskovia flava TaxID=2986422 RepID=UPI00223F0BEC|nr:glycosyl hydrolase family 18 protein [Oerskovia sp. JB1-3-2]